MGEPSFFVGVGAQRSGTTWVGHYLRRLPDVRFSPIKEINYFDSKYVEARRGAVHYRFNTKLAVLGLGNYTRKHPRSGAALSYHYLGIRRLRDASYRAYFDELARSGQTAGEISPSYAMLDEAAIDAMDRLLGGPKYFFIMRNPVDRLVSQYSFLSSRPELALPTGGEDLAERLLNLSQISQHTDYAKSLARYLSVVPETRFRVMFTEALFGEETSQLECDGLCDFLGVGRATVDRQTNVNRAPAVSIDKEIRRKLVGSLSEQYRFVGARYGDALPASWQSDVALLN
ncbi:MAG: sulfotransferase [Pseudomonadota bacterium]